MCYCAWWFTFVDEIGDYRNLLLLNGKMKRCLAISVSPILPSQNRFIEGKKICYRTHIRIQTRLKYLVVVVVVASLKEISLGVTGASPETVLDIWNRDQVLISVFESSLNVARSLLEGAQRLYT